MGKFVNYLDPSIGIEELLRRAFGELYLIGDRQAEVLAFLRLIKIKDLATYEHSVRVGLLARRIAKFMHLDEKALFYAGLLHDIGKIQTRLETLQKTENWKPADSEEMEQHVLDGYRMLRGHFNFSAEVILWHHRFQKNSYPKELPTLLFSYSEGTKTMIAFFGRILALADCFDALHRCNEKFWGWQVFTGELAKEKMLEFNPDQRVLIDELYAAGIFTTSIFP